MARVITISKGTGSASVRAVDIKDNDTTLTPLEVTNQVFAKFIKNTNKISKEGYLEDLRKDFELAQKDSSPKPKLERNKGTLYVGFDTEWQKIEGSDENEVLSYQLVCSNGKNPYLIRYFKRTNGSNKNFRNTLKSLLRDLIKEAKNEDLIKDVGQVVIFGHFLKADLLALKDAKDIMTNINSIRKTFATLDARLFFDVELEEVSDLNLHIKNYVTKIDCGKAFSQLVEIKFYDTMLISSNGSSLAQIGNSIGLEKLNIPEPYLITRMKEYLKKDKKGFKAYAMRDAEIALIYGIKFKHFCENELGIKGFIPATLSSAGIALFKKTLSERSFNEIFGKELVGVKKFNKNTNKDTVIKRIESTFDNNFYDWFAVQSYHGGRNECFEVGPCVNGPFYDYDLPSAYTTSMLELRPLDYQNAYQTNNIEDFIGDVLGIARVSFRFPRETRFPSLPVRTNNGILFPLEGVSICSAPEIEVAKNMGAELIIEKGVVIPWLDDFRIFEPFVKLIHENRKMHPKKSFAELIFKEIGNSLYGKLAQGLREKTQYNPKNNASEKLSRSAISNPYYASHVTGFCRAVIAELLCGISNDRDVLSVTTDGFLTNAELNSIKQGSLSKRFISLRENAVNSSGILEQKHVAQEVVPFKTRGCATLKAFEEQEPILAKAGVQPPVSKEQHNEYMLKLYFNRFGGQTHSYKRFPSVREVCNQELDMVERTQESILNLEFDMKREPCFVEEVETKFGKHVHIKTKPWKNVDEMATTRALFDGWRYHKQGVIKTLEDWEVWHEYLVVKKSTTITKMRITKEGCAGILKRIFLRAFTRKIWGAECDFSYSEMSKYLKENGYKATVSDIKKSKEQELFEKAVPLTRDVLKLLKILLKICPDLELEKFFATNDLAKVQQLNKARETNET